MGEDRLRAWIREDFGVELTALDRVDHGLDTAAAVWCGTGSGGDRYAVKWSGGGSTAGLLVPARLAALGVPGIAAPLTARSGKPWSEREGRRLSLVPWVSDEGALGRMTERHWQSFGALLARVHAAPAGMADLLPRERRDHERWAAEVRSLDERLRAPSGDHLVRALAADWRTASGRIGDLLEQAGDLAGRLPDRPGVVCHGDPHLGNVLVRGDERVWLIDWDDAVLAPPELDLMFVLGGVLYFAPVGPREQAWFFDGYGPVDLDPALVAYYRSMRALEDLTELAAQVGDVTGYPESERAEALAHFRGVLSPTGLADLALSSPAMSRNPERLRLPDERVHSGHPAG
ncbi:phosphotransferase enzyme family protein [Amycolatopsis anabasis]|uniref:phosphotransferase enzyme family protein n=1 Tax=Amycolatopsis anabasis TaxID=1840409 RepID=UPI00131D94DA|nr:phosphotransferase [Amycolatopsis anabasis]